MKISSLATVQIKDLLLKVIIGTQPHERETRQDILVNIEFVYDAYLAASTDTLSHAVDYGTLYDKIISKTGSSRFFLLEKLGAFILELVMEDEKILSATVTVEKAGVLKQARAVAVRLSADKKQLKTTADLKTTRCY